MKNEKDEVVFEQPVRHLVLPVKGYARFKPGDVTPTVENLETWLANNVAPFTITDFKKGANEQRIKVLGDGFTSVANNANIKTSTGATKLLAANLIYVFTHINGVWYEDADLNSGGGGAGPQGPPGISFVARDGKDGKDSLIPGPAGAKGNVGNTGAQGIQGAALFALDGKPGPMGISLPGEKGDRGIQGIAGPSMLAIDGKQGPMGISLPGEKGNTGIQGIAGPSSIILDGKPGPMGFPGPPGLQGPQGIQGIPGTGGSGSAPAGLIPRDGIAGPMGFPVPTQGIKISSLPVAAAFLDAMEFPVNDAGTSKKLTGTLLKAYVGDTIVNASIADQAVGASVTNYLTDSALAVPVGKLRLRSWFRWKVWVDKTAAGTVALVFLVKIGTLGTTGDTTLFTITLGVGTAAVDTGWLDITVILRGPLTNSGLFIMEAMFDHTLATTGLNNVQRQTQQTVSAAFDVTTAGLILGLAVTTGALYALTFRAITAEAEFL